MRIVVRADSIIPGDKIGDRMVVSITPYKKESSLYKIRTRRAIGERLGKIIDYLKTRFIGERMFFLPFQWLFREKPSYPKESTQIPSYCPPSYRC